MKTRYRILLTLFCLSLHACATAQHASKASVKPNLLAEKMLIYQLSNGGWPKQLEDKSVVNYENPIDDALLAKIKATTYLHATIDNKATTREIVALAKAYKETGNANYLKSLNRGLDFLLKAQYANGGWPQYYPDKNLYRAQITFNDDAIVNVLNIMQDIVTQKNDFDVVAQSYLTKAQESVDKGIACILKLQVLQNGNPTIWAAQYDPNSLKPAKARAFEPASLSTSESVNVVRFLMRIENPSTAVKNAINNAVSWFDATKITGFKFEKMVNGDRGLIADPTATIWARFYDLNSNLPIFGDRDNSVKSNVADISYERRNSYGWYGVWANNLLKKDYPKWKKTNQQ